MFSLSRNVFLQIVVFAFILICWINSSSLRLPTAIVPTKYYLHITTNVHKNNLTFTGNVTIDLTVKESTDQIVLHAKELREFQTTLINKQNGRQFENLSSALNLEENTLRLFALEDPLLLKAGEQYRLEILYVGDIRTNHDFGLYKSEYKDKDNNTIPIAVTQLEPTSARLVFPCFDEPALKANFVVSITHGSNYTAVSNMPVNGSPSQSLGNMVTTTFLETPLCPTYLIALVISNFNHISEIYNGIEHRVFFPAHLKENGQRALKNSIKSISSFSNYLGVEYSLPKLDHIFVDKSYGLAMENWGLILYSKKAFLPNNIEEFDKEEVMSWIIMQNHEMAHQWFGNLVSPKWWTYTWLNEGIGTYFSYIMADIVYPDEKVLEYFITKEEPLIFQFPVSKAITSKVETDGDIMSSFNVAAYKFAPCIIKMFHHAIGQKTFIKGVAKYLKKFQYSVADEDDFFKSIQLAVDEDGVQIFQNDQGISTVMHTWTHNIGFPIVTVTRNYDNDMVTISQTAKNDENIEQKWWIPLNFATASNPNFDKTTADYIMPPQKEVTINLKDIGINISSSDWLIVNKQQTGVYYVIYDNQNLKLISKALKEDHSKIHKYNRALLFRDLTGNFNESLKDSETFLKLMLYLKSEEDMTTWNFAANFIKQLFIRLKGSQVYPIFQSLVTEVLSGVFDKMRQQAKEDLFVASDLIARESIYKIALESNATDCQKFTDSFIRRQTEKDLLICFMCEKLKNITLDEFKGLLVKNVILASATTLKFQNFILAFECIESLEIVEFILNTIFDSSFEYNKEINPDIKELMLQRVLALETLTSKAIPAVAKNGGIMLVLALRYGILSVQDLKKEQQEKEDQQREQFQNKFLPGTLIWLQNYQKQLVSKNNKVM